VFGKESIERSVSKDAVTTENANTCVIPEFSEKIFLSLDQADGDLGKKFSRY
jgi:hypothetical protein